MTQIFAEAQNTGRDLLYEHEVYSLLQKKLEELIFTLDPEAFVIFENTFNVIGKGFSRRKVY